MTGDLQEAKPHLESLRNLAESLPGRHSLTNVSFASALASILEGDWDADRHFPDQGLAESSMEQGAWRIACIWSWNWVNSTS